MWIAVVLAGIDFMNLYLFRVFSNSLFRIVWWRLGAGALLTRHSFFPLFFLTFLSRPTVPTRAVSTVVTSTKPRLASRSHRLQGGGFSVSS